MRVVLTAALLLCAFGSFAESEEGDPAGVSVPVEYVQVWLGSTDADESWLLEEDGNEVAGDYDNLPLGGGVGQRMWGDGAAQYGWEGGGLVSWQNDSVEYAGGSPGLIVAVEADLFLVDVFMGGVVAVQPARWLRMYAAAGPAIAYAHISGENDPSDSDSTIIVSGPNSFIVIDADDDFDDFSFTAYARAGLEFEFASGFTVGASVRYADHDFDLDELGKLELDEVQWFLTLGARF